MINRLYLEPETQMLIREIGLLTMRVSESTIYRAVRNANLNTFYNYGNCKVVPGTEIWKLCSQPCFKRYFKKLLKRSYAGCLDKDDDRHFKFYEDKFKTEDELQESFLTVEDMINLGLPGLTDEEIKMGVYTGFIPSFRWHGKWFIQNWFRKYWERELSPDRNLTM